MRLLIRVKELRRTIFEEYRGSPLISANSIASTIYSEPSAATTDSHNNEVSASPTSSSSLSPKSMTKVSSGSFITSNPSTSPRDRKYFPSKSSNNSFTTPTSPISTSRLSMKTAQLQPHSSTPPSPVLSAFAAVKRPHSSAKSQNFISKASSHMPVQDTGDGGFIYDAPSLPKTPSIYTVSRAPPPKVLQTCHDLTCERCK